MNAFLTWIKNLFSSNRKLKTIKTMEVSKPIWLEPNWQIDPYLQSLARAKPLKQPTKPIIIPLDAWKESGLDMILRGESGIMEYDKQVEEIGGPATVQDTVWQKTIEFKRGESQNSNRDKPVELTTTEDRENNVRYIQVRQRKAN